MNRLSLPLSLAMLAMGCAMNEHGSVHVARYESDSAMVVTLDAWGFHLITNSADAGLTLGHSRRTYVFAKHLPGQQATAFPLPPDVGAVTPVDRATGWLPQGDPMVFCNRSDGISLDMNRHRIGLAAGVHTSEAIDLPADFSGLLFVNLDPRDPSRSQAIIREEAR